ncbi:isochorismatase family protein [Candidatus Parcubacteria bacterium]|nr:isochorismatase family protein [Candidatus Parcubacteria bacterium]
MKTLSVNGIEYRQDEVASIDVDAENCFTDQCPGELPVPGGEEIVDELNGQAALAYYRVGSKDAHSMASWWVDTDKHPQFEAIKGYEDMDLRWKLHGVPGTHGFNLIAGLPPVKMYTYFIWKGIEINMHPYGACFHDLTEQMSTGLIEYLRSEGWGYPKTYAIINNEKVKYHKKGVKLVIVGGLATNYCVLVTVLQLLKAGFTVIINLGACRAILDGTEESAIKQMEDAGAITVKSYTEIIVK